MGYGSEQITELEATFNAVPCDLVLIGTSIDLGGRIPLAALKGAVLLSDNHRWHDVWSCRHPEIRPSGRCGG